MEGEPGTEATYYDRFKTQCVFTYTIDIIIMTRKHAIVVEAVEMRREVRVSLELNTVQFLSHDSHMTYTHTCVCAKVH